MPVIEDINYIPLSDEVEFNETPINPLNYIYSENMFLSEIKGLTHWFLLYDEKHLYAWNIVRNTY